MLYASAAKGKEAFEAGWMAHHIQAEAQAKGRRPGTFDMMTGASLYVKDKGWVK